MFAVTIEADDTLSKEEWVFFTPQWHDGKQQLTVALHRYERSERPSTRHKYRSVYYVENNGGGFKLQPLSRPAERPVIPATVADRVRAMLTPVFVQEVGA